MQAKQGDVVAGVADDRNLRFRRRRAQAAQEPGAADASGEQGDSHGPSLPGEMGQTLTGDQAGVPGLSADFPVITGKRAGFITYLP